MTQTVEFKKQTTSLIDNLKSICANYGLGNDGNEFKIITREFLYKFLNDKFIHDINKPDDRIARAKGSSYELTGNNFPAYGLINSRGKL